MIFAVTGGRDYQNFALVCQVLDALLTRVPDLHLIHGAARGADTLARCWAESHGVPHTPYPADWTQHGKSAGAIRNRQMIQEGKPELVVAFPGGRGTQDMVDASTKAGIRILDLRTYAKVPVPGH